jgi:subtilisin family serine protease
MGDDDHFIGVMRIAGMPGRNLEIGGLGFGGEHSLCGAMGADQRFQQRITRQPVRAVQTRAGHFPDRVKPGNVRLAVHVCDHAAALVMAYKPNLANSQIMGLIKYTADDVNSSTHPGVDDFLGYGRINLKPY